MHSPDSFAAQVVARAFKPAAALFVDQLTSERYRWVACPRYFDDARSSLLTETAARAFWVALQRFDHRDAAFLLDRLSRSSPVTFQVRTDEIQVSSDEVLAEIYFLIRRFAASRPDAALLTIPAQWMEMNLTFQPIRHKDLQDATAAARADLPLAAWLGNCPVCSASPALIETAYPGTEGCLRCNAIFVARI